MNVTTQADARSPARLLPSPNFVAGCASAVLYLMASLAMLAAPQPDSLALCLATAAAVQLVYMALKPTLPWALVVFWVLAQWQTALLALERAPTTTAVVLLALAVVVQAWLVLSIGLQSLGHLCELRRLPDTAPPPDKST